ncbi:WD domain G-beta repeat protein [Theileria parva strain Muguga]|uniref:WD domain G-beta repeat protein n=1 Tax=Theileria parva strain Muguga TaxID=333668 RepID=UPI001C622705|nr:WD domain G-beta repeat protein [Theileria parva strain Muguga]EAN31837.2 WD domain G-beta repeat protein [Theileria parva strain Muguga]
MALYHLANICGSQYSGGRICFNPDASCVLAPVGNRINIYDLQTNKSSTLSSETRTNIVLIANHPSKPLSILVDDNGFGYILNLIRDKIVHRLQFKSSTNISTAESKGYNSLNTQKKRLIHASFSPYGKYFAVSIQKKLLVWLSPDEKLSWRMTLHLEITGHMDNINSLDWSKDSKYICTSSKDLTVRLWCVEPDDTFVPVAFVDHRRSVKAAFFTDDMNRICSVSKEGVIIIWKRTDLTNGDNAAKLIGSRSKNNFLKKSNKLNDSKHSENQQSWIRETKGYCNQPANSTVSVVTFNSNIGLFVVGFTGGTFGLYNIPELTTIYTLKIGEQIPVIDSVDITSDGQWIALACSQTGTIVVWEWKSETFVMKQQAHLGGVRCCSFSYGSNLDRLGSLAENKQDFDRALSSKNLGMGTRFLVATGGFDGKVKLWDNNTGLCYVTLTEHSASVEAIAFTPQGNALISASLDGTVRCFDLFRFKNFRVLTATRTQYTSVAVDGSGTIVAAGTKGDTNSVFIWQIQTGKVLDELVGHTAPVTSVSFHPHPSYNGFLVSSSWDNTIKIWNVFGRKDKAGSVESVLNSSSVISTAFDPRGNSILAASVLSGQILFWDLDNVEQIGSIDGLRDIQPGRHYTEAFSAINIKKDPHSINRNNYFNSLSYSSCGTMIVCTAKNSPHVAVYSTENYLLLHVFTLTRNDSLSGVKRFLSSKYMTEYGFSVHELDLSDEEIFEDSRKLSRIQAHKSLPGVEVGEFKVTQDRFNVWEVNYSPDGRQFAVSTSQGVFIYSLDVTRNVEYTNQMLKSVHNFQPQIITKSVTKSSILSHLEKNDFVGAFILALAMNNFKIMLKAYEAVPTGKIASVVSSLDSTLVLVLLNFIRNVLNTYSTNGTTHLGLHLVWLSTIFSIHQNTLSNYSGSQTSTESLSDLRTMMLLLLRQIRESRANILGLLASNAYSFDYLCNLK